MHASRGFTLVELIITMVISAIIAVVVSQFISRPMEAFAGASHRARLLDTADSALQTIVSDIRAALPNSIRTGCSGTCLEFLHTVDGGRYRAQAPGDILDFIPANTDTSFDVLGDLNNVTEIATGSAADDCENNLASCLVVYNTGQINADAYNLDNAATITGASASAPYSISFDNSAFSSGLAAFPTPSPGQRFHIVDTPVSYLCNTTSGTVKRYDNYPINASHGSVDTDAELMAFTNTEVGMVSNKISDCNFSYNSGSLTRSGLVTVRLTLTETFPSGHSESATLLQQAHVTNVP